MSKIIVIALVLKLLSQIDCYKTNKTIANVDCNIYEDVYFNYITNNNF